MKQQNFLAVCNDKGVPLQDFREAFCGRCLQPECELSLAGRSKFEARVATWEERLFTSPARMPKTDPLYSQIVAKKFIEIPTGPVPEIRGPSEWIDPREVPPPSTQELPRPAPPPPVKKSEPVEVSAPSEKPLPARRASQPLQTPFQQGTSLPGAPEIRPSPPSSDPWSVPTPNATDSTAGIKIVGPGAKIRFGGS